MWTNICLSLIKDLNFSTNRYYARVCGVNDTPFDCQILNINYSPNTREYVLSGCLVERQNVLNVLDERTFFSENQNGVNLIKEKYITNIFYYNFTHPKIAKYFILKNPILCNLYRNGNYPRFFFHDEEIMGLDDEQNFAFIPFQYINSWYEWEIRNESNLDNLKPKLDEQCFYVESDNEEEEPFYISLNENNKGWKCKLLLFSSSLTSSQLVFQDTYVLLKTMEELTLNTKKYTLSPLINQIVVKYYSMQINLYGINDDEVLAFKGLCDEFQNLSQEERTLLLNLF